MPKKNDLGDFIGDVHIEVHKNGIIVFSRKKRSEIRNKEKNVTVDNLEDFIINKSNEYKIDEEETLKAISKEVEEIEKKRANKKNKK